MTFPLCRPLAAAVLAVPAFVLTACVGIDGKAERHLVTTEPTPASLEIVSRFCDVSFGLSTTNEVAIDASVFLETSGGNETAEREIEFVNVFVKRVGDKLVIRQGEEGKSWSFNGPYSARGSITVKLPANIPVTVSTASGDVNGKGDFGAIAATISTASGDISLRDFGATTTSARTASGDGSIKVVRPLDALTWAAASGDLTFDGGAGSVKAESASGDVSVKGVTGAFTSSTASGDVSVVFLGSPAFLLPATRLKASTASGDVVFVIPTDVLPGGSISTASGDIQIPNDVPKDVARRSVTMKGPNATVEVSTASGDVTIRR